MGQNNSFHFNITNVIKDWIPFEKDRSVLVNIKTQQQLQCFYVHISTPQLRTQLNIYNARMQTAYPHVCRVAYYNEIPAHPQLQATAFRQFAVYSDRLIMLKDNQWTLHRFVQAIEGIATLAPFYGYFRLTEQTMRVNEKGETKLWISQNPANNHRDVVLASEEQALAALAGLAVRKNYQVANLLIGCKSLSQAMQRLNTPHRKTSSPMSNKASTSMNQSKYKNVFKDERGKERSPKFTVSGLSAMAKEEFKPYSYCGNTEVANNQYRETKMRSYINQPQHANNRNSEKYALRPETQHFESNIAQHNRRRVLKNPNQTVIWSTSKQPLTSLKAAPFTAKSYMKADNQAVVMNQTVNISKNQSKPQNSAVWSQLRNAKTPDFPTDHMKQLSRSPFEKKIKIPVFIQERQRKDKSTYKHNVGSFYNHSQKSQEYICSPKPSLHEISNIDQTRNSGNSGNYFKSTQESFKNAEKGWNVQPGRRNQKLFTFKAKTPTKLFSTSFSPHSHTPFTPPAPKIQQNSMTVYFKKPNRTKTTDFNDKSNKMLPKSLALFSPENKSFVHQTDNSYILQSDKSFEHQEGNERGRGKVCHSQAIAEEISENIPTSKSIAVNSVVDTGKVIEQKPQKANLKKQLKLQFGDLLGVGPKIEKAQIIKVTTAQSPQSNLKQKIQQKKMAFAQLKKEALAVLTDLF